MRRVHSDGTVDISYDDGDSDTRLKEKYVRALDSGSDSDRKRSRSRSRSPKRGRKLREGAKIEARYRLAPAWKITEFCRHLFHSGGRSKFYKGKIDRDRKDGTYDIACATRCPTPSMRRV